MSPPESSNGNGHVVESPRETTSPTDGLFATISAREPVFDSSLSATVDITIENRGQRPEQLALFVLSSPILFLELLDGEGELVLPLPPPTPPLEREVVELRPGEIRRITHSLDVFAPELSSGSYTIRVRHQRIPSNELTITIR